VLPPDVPFEEIIRRSNLRAMEYLYERGPIMRLLASDRSIAGLVKRQDHDERTIIIDYFTRRCREVYGFPEDVATVCAIMSVNAPILSARALRRSGISAQRAAEIWSEFTIGGNNALQAKFGKPNKVVARRPDAKARPRRRLPA
jgi:hypothetical protein